MGVYTRSGDHGETGLVGGTRISKSDFRLELYGTADELNSMLGLAISHIEDKKVKERLYSIQSLLFSLGSNLACEEEKRESFKLPQLEDKHIKLLEDEIDQMEASLPKLTNFILPGGSHGAACLHVCRTLCRRLERMMITHGREGQPHNALIFVNRLSDYFFVLARNVNDQDEIIWKA